MKTNLSKMPSADQFCRLAPFMAPSFSEADRASIVRLAQLAQARDISVDGAVQRLLTRLFNTAWSLSAGLEFPATLALRMPSQKAPLLVVVHGIRLQRVREEDSGSSGVGGLSLHAYGNALNPDGTPATGLVQEALVTQLLEEGLDASVRDLSGQWRAPRFEPRLSGELLELLRTVRQWHAALEQGDVLPRTSMAPERLSVEQMTDEQGLIAGVAPMLLWRAAEDLKNRYLTASSFAKLLGCSDGQAQQVLETMQSAGWVRRPNVASPYEVDLEAWRSIRALA